MSYYKTREDLERLISLGKKISIIKSTWISMTKGNLVYVKKSMLEEEEDLKLLVSKEELETISNKYKDFEDSKLKIDSEVSSLNKELHLKLYKEELDLQDWDLKSEDFITTYRTNKFNKELGEIVDKQTKNAYSLISGREVSDSQREIYKSKGWLAEIVAKRNPNKLKELAQTRLGSETQDNINLIIAEAKKDLNTAYIQHKNEYKDNAYNTIEEYANYIVEVGIFWKKAEGALLNDIGAVKNKLIQISKTNIDLAETLLTSVQQLKSEKGLTTAEEKLDSIRNQVLGLLNV